MTSTSVRRATRASSALALLVLSLSVTGCGSSGEAPVATPGATGTTAKAAVKKPAPAKLVKQVTLRNSDFKPGLKVKLSPGGDKVAGQITLNNCGDTFSTESHRVARRQIDLVSAKGEESGISNEVVAYDRPEQAAKALKQYRKSVVGCRKNVYHKSKQPGVPELRYQANTLTRASGLPVKDTALVRQTVLAKGYDRPLHLVLFLQRHDAVLNVVYLQSVAKPTDAEVANLHTLAVITGKRLAVY
jgi:hypothetical protein